MNITSSAVETASTLYCYICSLLAGSAIGWSTVRMIAEGGLG
ncbi:hypothetical protein SADFL11_00036260 [Roseibium alexandrii DFL-11]|uniref:Uncharacterized protein n=1 Tax=Roseibium alexandrii (strain DSM 17067 / NCIMB 14079 / DFL-11) TaxID=244592 RepID=A0A5E8UWN5_ROSAD|nr:hypothetical protein SADFL11_00036260 [Roseibium alexandrii DFL-11]